jgi:hypothetical protein
VRNLAVRWRFRSHGTRKQLALLARRQAARRGIDGEYLVAKSAQRRNDLCGARYRDIAFLTRPPEQYSNLHKDKLLMPRLIAN